MKLFWKLFCSMVLITALACSLGGYVLIDQQFRTSLDREVSAIYEENDLLRYALNRELKSYTAVIDRDALKKLAANISITTSQGDVSFRISDQAGNTVTGVVPVAASGLTAQLPEDRRGWELLSLSTGRTYLHAASPLHLEDSVFYLENCRDITELFTTRQEQYRNFSMLMLALAVAVGALALVVTRLMLRPLSHLSAATERMAAGELAERVPVRGDDELAQLSADFNAMAAQLELQVQALKDAAQRQEDFIGSFAHEIKTPLTSIIGYADLLRSRPATAEQVREAAGYIFSEGRRLESLSRKLMDLIVLDKQEFSLRPVPMDAFLRRVGGALRPVLEQQGISLTVRAESAAIPLEPDLMETVLLNLLDNARKSMDHGGHITLEGLIEGDGYCIRVTDQGKGIPETELKRVTEAFYMVDKSRARAQGGAGLGLAICQRIVTLHGGIMEFQSTEGAGTRVCVHLKGEIGL